MTYKWVSKGIIIFILIVMLALSMSYANAGGQRMVLKEVVGMGLTERVSVISDGTQANNISFTPDISGNGRYITFISEASNLVNDDANEWNYDVFVFDLKTRQIEMVSLASDGTQGNNTSGISRSSISQNGRFVVFDSRANNLVIGDSNNQADIFVRDRVTNTTELVSVASDGTLGNAGSSYPSISADGRYVAFDSHADNLVLGDGNGKPDIFVHDRQTGDTVMVSIASDGTQSNGYSSSPSISSSGYFIAFVSSADNLVDDTNFQHGIFVHDMQMGETERVSVSSNGTPGNDWSSNPSISDDGRYVAFGSNANNLVPGDTNNNADIFIHDRQMGETKCVSVSTNGIQGNNISFTPDISSDGRYVVFSSAASNLVEGDNNTVGFSDVFLRDMVTSQTTLVSVASDGTQGNHESSHPTISDNGQIIAFESSADNLVLGDTNGHDDIFFHDRFGMELTFIPLLVR